MCRVRTKFRSSRARIASVAELLVLIGRAPCDGAEDRGVRRRAELLFVLCLNDARPRGRRAAGRGTASARRVGGAPRGELEAARG